MSKINIKVGPEYVQINLISATTINGKKEFKDPSFMMNIEYEKFINIIDIYNKTIDDNNSESQI